MMECEDAIGGAAPFTRTLVVDDQVDVRASWAEVVEDAELQPVVVSGPYRSRRDLIAETESAGADSVLCDYDLTSSRWSPVAGAELVASWYRRGVPAVLCTQYEARHILEMRKWRRYVPCLLSRQELDPESLLAGLFLAKREIEGSFVAERRPWRTLVVVEQVLRFQIRVRVPGSHFPEQEVGLLKSGLPPNVVEALPLDRRVLHAKVNVGASKPEDLFFYDWELR